MIHEQSAYYQMEQEAAKTARANLLSHRKKQPINLLNLLNLSTGKALSIVPLWGIVYSAKEFVTHKAETIDTALALFVSLSTIIVAQQIQDGAKRNNDVQAFLRSEFHFVQ